MNISRTNFLMNSLVNDRICSTTEVENAQWEKEHTFVCPICEKTFVGNGNNPYPVADYGRCCDDCNVWVTVMRDWLDSNHDWLKGMVNKLSRRCCTITSRCQINGVRVVFTIYNDLLMGLYAVAYCSDSRCDKCFEGALRNWLTKHCSDKNLTRIKTGTECGVSAFTFLANEGYELPEKMLYNW